ncbi:MAG: hypothetical protein AB7N90_10070, partial [Vicinamibacterales bacterium]
MRAWRAPSLFPPLLLLAFLAMAAPVRGQPAGVATTITAEDAVRLALQHNQPLAAQRLDVDQARADETTASLKPNLTVYSANADFPVFHPHNFSWNHLTTNQSFAEGVSYLFERGGKRRGRQQVAADTTEVAARTVSEAERQ